MKRKNRWLALALAGMFASTGAVEITPNTRSFNLTNYAYKDDTSPNILLYNVAGFYVADTPLVSQRVFILPSIRYTSQSIQFVDKSGNYIKDMDDVTEDNLNHVEIRLWHNGNLPTREQSIGVISQLQSTPVRSVPRYIPFDLNFLSNPNYITWGLAFPAKAAIESEFKKLNDEAKAADALYQTWQQRSPQVVGIKSFVLRARIDGEVVGETAKSKFLVPAGQLPNVYLKGLTTYQINRIKNQGFEIEVEYAFQDQKTSTVNAHFDFKAMMERVIDDSYSRVTQKKSKGWQFLGAGSRKSTMKDSIRQTLTDQTVGGTNGSTMIQMDDASDAQIAMFTEKFFPTLSRNQLIDNHLAAAEKAETDGKSELADAHRKFAEDVRNDKPDLNVDTEKALAALNKDDYVGFIAHGLKVGSTASKGTFEYHRVLNAKSELVKKEDWVSQGNTSVDRTLVQLVPIQPVRRKPFFGMCNATNIQLGLWISEPNANWFPNPQPKNYFLPFCVIQNSPLANAGIGPGTIIESINGIRINNKNDLDAAFDGKQPGDVIQVVKLDQIPHSGLPGGVGFIRQRVNVPLAAGDITQQYQ
jgi:hypothetical protein